LTYKKKEKDDTEDERPHKINRKNKKEKRRHRDETKMTKKSCFFLSSLFFPQSKKSDGGVCGRRKKAGDVGIVIVGGRGGVVCVCVMWCEREGVSGKDCLPASPTSDGNNNNQKIRTAVFVEGGEGEGCCGCFGVGSTNTAVRFVDDVEKLHTTTTIAARHNNAFPPSMLFSFSASPALPPTSRHYTLVCGLCLCVCLIHNSKTN
jgi:hypothetical protein